VRQPLPKRQSPTVCLSLSSTTTLRHATSQRYPVHPSITGQGTRAVATTSERYHHVTGLFFRYRVRIHISSRVSLTFLYVLSFVFTNQTFVSHINELIIVNFHYIHYIYTYIYSVSFLLIQFFSYNGVHRTHDTCAPTTITCVPRHTYITKNYNYTI
jgi:hypothetical protein